MSNYESHKGKLLKIKDKLTKEEMEDFAKNHLIPQNITFPHKYYKDVFEYIRDNQDKYPYFFSEDSIYEIENCQLDPDEDEFWYIKNNDFTEYSFRFYNGGTCLEELIRELIEILEKK